MAKRGWVDHLWGFRYRTREQANKAVDGLRKKGWDARVVSRPYRTSYGSVVGYCIKKRKKG